MLSRLKAAPSAQARGTTALTESRSALDNIDNVSIELQSFERG